MRVGEKDFQIDVWDVFFVRKTRYTVPQKDKYVVVVTTDPSYYCFFINSRINEFIQKRPSLLPCEVAITTEENPFLRYDSFVDCQEVYWFTRKDLNDFRGCIAEEDRARILSGAKNCPALKQLYKNQILGE